MAYLPRKVANHILFSAGSLVQQMLILRFRIRDCGNYSVPAMCCCNADPQESHLFNGKVLEVGHSPFSGAVAEDCDALVPPELGAEGPKVDRVGKIHGGTGRAVLDRHRDGPCRLLERLGKL